MLREKDSKLRAVRILAPVLGVLLAVVSEPWGDISVANSAQESGQEQTLKQKSLDPTSESQANSNFQPVYPQYV